MGYIGRFQLIGLLVQRYHGYSGMRKEKGMDKQLKRKALKQYLHYFRFWFAAVVVLLIVFAAVAVMSLTKNRVSRTNNSAPAERVYDYADVLTDEEEQSLRDVIARTENRIHSDIVVVTIAEEVENGESSWEMGMQNRADDFYDENNYGYNEVHGDGVLILDNWYEGQKGSWLSTCGSVYLKFSSRDINQVLRAGFDVIEEHPYQAYMAYIQAIERKMSGGASQPFPAMMILIIPLVVLVVFVIVNMRSRIGSETVQPNSYVAGGVPVMKEKSDQLVNKFVTTRRIPKNTEGSSGHGGGGNHVSSGGGSRGGGHVSRSGVSHGGGGMRR